ncbi:hypothetical protein E3N88_11632 [Mikania micrantha]|uniref:HMG box domain-containing protein n=1 Tax=Mikania micrantha TaxID=192012 RepID=A0A5N6PDV7_9ASTR|nr:hypothetical protein E3N88_11632 [Mikania micrantha]
MSKACKWQNQPACPVTIRKSHLDSSGSGTSFLVVHPTLFHFTDHRSFLDMKGAKGKGAAKKDSLKPVDDKKVGKRKAPAKAVGKSKAKGGKAAKDPNKPKRPPSAFFVFLEEFRKTFKKENPNVKAVSAVGKAGGEKWKSMSAAEKAPYEAKAAKRKADYEKLMTAYNKKQESIAEEDDESEKSKSEVDEESGQEGGDDEEDEEEEEEEEDDD